MSGITVLAQQDQGNTGSLFVWLLVLIAVVVAGFVLVSWVRKQLKAPDEPTGGIGFTLSDLREMHRKGQISDEEFERAKGKMMASMKAAERKVAKEKHGSDTDGLTGVP